MLEIGSKFGDYTVVELLGKGAMGEVYRISDGRTEYALKIMSAKSDDPQRVHEWRRRFAREAETAMRIRHKNLVEVYDVGEDPATHLCYILMEYVGGGTLTDRLKAKGKLEIREAVAITMHVANALSAAHSIGIVHRDIKPDNIMFTSDGVPKLADLGIARYRDSEGETTVTKTEMIVGTPAYMSPEQMLDSHNVDARADIYSLGVVFYEMLTGLRPNQGSTIVELMTRAIKGEELPDVRELRPEVSVALAYALSRMVAQKADNRPQSAAEVARLVYDAATGKLQVKNVGMGKRTGLPAETSATSEGRETGSGEQWRGRLPLIISAVGGLLLAAVAARFLSMSKSSPSQMAPEEGVAVKTIYVTNVINQVKELRAETPAATKAQSSKMPLTTDSVFKGVRHIVKDGVEYVVEDGVLISANLNGEIDIAIPEGVKRIASRVFKDLKIRRVAIPRSMTCMNASFGDFAVEELHISDVADWCKLSSGTSTGWPTKGARLYLNGELVRDLIVPGSAVTIKPYVFMDIPSIERVVFEEGIQNIGSYAFYGCDKITQVSMPASLTSIDNFAFSHCDSLSSLMVAADNKVFEVRNGMLFNRTAKAVVFCPNSVVHASVPEGTERILKSAFCGNSRLKSVKLPASVKRIEGYAFCGCRNLRDVFIQDGVVHIGREAFSNCNKLDCIELPGSVVEIEEKAFMNCRNLRKATLPARFKNKIDGSVFDGCQPSKLKIEFGSNDGDSSARANQNAAAAPAKTVEIFRRLDRDDKAWAYSFEHVDGWEKPGFDDRKWRRAPGGFGNRKYQTEIRWAYINTAWETRNIYLRRHFNWDGGAVSRAVLEFFIDDSLNIYLNGQPIYHKHGSWIYWEMGEIDPRLFNSALIKGDNVLCVEAENTQGASYVDCGLRVETGGAIKEKLHDGVRKIKTDAGTWTILLRNGIVSLGDGRNVALDPEPMGELEIPAELGGLKITDLNVNCFRGCGLLKKVIVPEGITSIRQEAFLGCHELESISLPDSLEWILGKVFLQTKLKRLDIKNTRLLCGEALDQCALEEITVNPKNPTYFVKDGILFDRVRRSLVKCPVSRTHVTLPNGIESICSEAFQWSNVKSAVIPKSVKLIEPAAFHTCQNLESVEFMGDDAIINSLAFIDCTRLKKIVLPKKLKLLDDWAIFQGCRTLEEMTIPDTVERMSDAVFWGCHNLKRVKIGKRVEFMGPRMFDDCTGLKTIALPASLKHMGERMFLNCKSLKAVYFDGDKPNVVQERPFEGTPSDLVVYVRKGAKGWTDAKGRLPEKWPVGDPDARPIRYM